MGSWKYRSCGTMEISVPSCFVIALSMLVSASFFIYWLCIMGEWFRIVEHFGGFLSVQSWHICAGVVLGRWPVLVGFAWLGSGSSPFLIVGIVSLVWKAVLHLFAPGGSAIWRNSRPRPGARLPAESLLVVLDIVCGGKGSLLGS